MPVEEVKILCEKWSEEYPNLNFAGFMIHPGSQISALEPYRHAFSVLKDLVGNIQETADLKVHTLDLGGGIGIPYGERNKSFEMDLIQYGQLVREVSNHTYLT